MSFYLRLNLTALAGPNRGRTRTVRRARGVAYFGDDLACRIFRARKEERQTYGIEKAVMQLEVLSDFGSGPTSPQELG